jgi:hypothetical protein
MHTCLIFIHSSQSRNSRIGKEQLGQQARLGAFRSRPRSRVQHVVQRWKQRVQLQARVVCALLLARDDMAVDSKRTSHTHMYKATQTLILISVFFSFSISTITTISSSIRVFLTEDQSRNLVFVGVGILALCPHCFGLTSLFHCGLPSLRFCPLLLPRDIFSLSAPLLSSPSL